MSKEIIIEVDMDTGEVVLETIGFKGKSCITESQWVADLIGKEFHRDLTPAYFMKETDREVKKKYLNLCG